MFYFGKSDWRTFERGIEKEWLVTNEGRACAQKRVE